MVGLEPPWRGKAGGFPAPTGRDIDFPSVPIIWEEWPGLEGVLSTATAREPESSVSMVSSLPPVLLLSGGGDTG